MIILKRYQEKIIYLLNSYITIMLLYFQFKIKKIYSTLETIYINYIKI